MALGCGLKQPGFGSHALTSSTTALGEGSQAQDGNGGKCSCGQVILGRGQEVLESPRLWQA